MFFASDENRCYLWATPIDNGRSRSTPDVGPTTLISNTRDDPRRRLGSDISNRNQRSQRSAFIACLPCDPRLRSSLTTWRHCRHEVTHAITQPGYPTRRWLKQEACDPIGHHRPQASSGRFRRERRMGGRSAEERKSALDHGNRPDAPERFRGDRDCVRLTNSGASTASLTATTMTHPSNPFGITASSISTTTQLPGVRSASSPTFVNACMMRPFL
jgi:hypothetical protein